MPAEESPELAAIGDLLAEHSGQLDTQQQSLDELRQAFARQEAAADELRRLIAETPDTSGLEARMATIEAGLGQLRRGLEALASDAAKSAQAKADKPALWWWPDLKSGSPEEAGAWERLNGWVKTVVVERYGYTKLPDCWLQHPKALDQLTALYGTWLDAYRNPEPSLTAPAHFFDRWYPNFLKHLAEELESCLGGHLPPGRSPDDRWESSGWPAPGAVEEAWR